MLEAIRKRSASILVKLLFGLLILSFAVWGISDTITGNIANQPVASVGDLEIPPHVFQSEYQREAQRVRQALGGQLDVEQMRELGLGPRVLDQLINRALLSQGANDLRLAVSDDVVRREITNMQAFRGPLGKFDRNQFQQVLFSSGMTEDQFVADLRLDLARAQFLGSLTAIGALPDTAVVPLYQHGEQRRVAEMIRFGDESAPPPGEPDAAALSQFHKDNAARFTAPEYRAVTYVLLKAEDLVSEVSVSTDEIKEAYDQRSDEFIKQETRNLQQMNLPDEKTAIQAHNRLVGGDDFAAVAKEVAEMDAESIELGQFTRDDLPDEALANAAFQLPNGGFSTPVETGLGWHIVRVTKIERGHQMDLNEAAPKLKEALAREKAVDALFDLSNRLEDTLGGGATLEEASSALNVSLSKVPAIDAQGRDANGETVKDLPAASKFTRAAFELGEGEDSVLTETGDDGFFILRVDGITEPALRPLDSIRNQVIVAWQEAERAKGSRGVAEKALERAKSSTDLATIAKDSGEELVVSSAFTRLADGAPADATPEVIDQVFKLKLGEAAIVRGGDATFLVRLKEIKQADPATAKAQVDTLRDQVTSAMRNDLLAQLTNGLRQKFPVSINSQVAQELY